MLTYNHIRQENIEDAVKLFQEMSADSSKEYTDILTTFIDNHPEKIVTIAYADSNPVGLAVIHQWDIFPKPGKTKRKYWQLSNFFITAQHRNNGSGKNLLNTYSNKLNKQT